MSPTAPIESIRPTRLKINLGQIRQNLQALQSAVPDCAMMPILKANAYGHGLVVIARTLVDAGIENLGVAYLEEAIELQEAGIHANILVLGGIVGRQIPRFIERNLVLTASSLDKLQAIDQTAQSMNRVARVHLKIDTGMERIGTHWYSAKKLLEASLRCQSTQVEGIYSHLANSDSEDLSSTHVQLERFEELLQFYPQHSLPFPIRHIANSGAMLRLPESRLDLVRPGLALFGFAPSAHVPLPEGVHPAMQWTSRVVYFKVIPAGAAVSYGSTWKSEKMTRIVTIPVGYGDGYFRSMSGRAEVLINHKRYPVVGSICMDQLMVDVGWDECFNGDEVTLMGTQGDLSIHVEELADWAGTLNYEVLTAINTRVPRVY
jgi:alanine racemase